MTYKRLLAHSPTEKRSRNLLYWHLPMADVRLLARRELLVVIGRRLPEVDSWQVSTNA